MDKPIFYQGQQVGCLMYGEGMVHTIHHDFLLTESNNKFRTYTLNGINKESLRPTLYPIEQYRAIIANIPAPEPEAWKPKPGEWCWFWDDVNNKYNVALCRFSEYGLDNYIDQHGVSWDKCAPFTGELPEHLKEVQP